MAGKAGHGEAFVSLRSPRSPRESLELFLLRSSPFTSFLRCELRYLQLPPLSPSATWHSKGSDPSRVRGCIFFQIIPDVPHRAVVGGIDCGLRVVLPADRRRLRCLSLDERALAHRELPGGIGSQATGESLPRKVGSAAE